ncbi:MAG TPA: ABC transporter ATP-binding protein/permease [Steroidobacteraceae bacterium]|jgi:putative ATP-binding cassette transporter|nr:ABC transporter ATP-binding protein/permease [Steroidobacteraceae bacterium]
MSMMRRALWASPVRNKLVLLAVSIFLVIAATAYGQIRLNRWNQPFYDALSHRNLSEFLIQLGIFGIIAGALLVLNVAQRWIGETLKLRLRQGLVHDLVQNWMVPGRAFRLASAGDIGVNPDQRMHEDARHLTELSADLGIGLLQDSLLLTTFITVLWSLSSSFVFHVAGRTIAIPGYMVWAAVVYSGSASLLSYWVGKSLIGRNADRYAREADLRFSLVRVNEHIDSIALAEGEPDEARRIDLDLQKVLEAMRLLVRGTTSLTWVTAGYGWFTTVAPILVAAPLYFGGQLSFGGLMMASGAFMQVQSSLRWFVDNFSTLADWRATLLRVASFRRALLAVDEMQEVARRIDYAAGEPGKIVLERLEICSPAGAAKLSESHVEVQSGERVLVLGETGIGRTLLFRALAGLWPWGEGRIARHSGESTLYLPRAPYLPPGTLREILAYPSSVETFKTEACLKALERLGLERLVPLLDEARRWETMLSDGEHQSLAFARALLHAPAWLIIDEALEALEEDTLPKVVDILSNDLTHTGVLYIGRSGAHDKLFRRTLHLINGAAPTGLPPFAQSAKKPAVSAA